MDADDISSENRLFVQINFLEKNNHVDVVGSNVEYYDRSNNFLSYSKLPLKHKEISKNLIKKNVIIHSTTIFREKFINQLNGYRDFFYNAQDYDLWLRGRNKFIYENLNERLLKHKLDKRKKITNELYDVYAKILNFKFDKNILTSISWIIISISLIIVKRFNYKSKNTVYGLTGIDSPGIVHNLANNSTICDDSAPENTVGLLEYTDP